MDAGNVNFQIVSHGPLNASPGACRQTNDEHAAACKKNSARFGGFSMLPMAEPAAAADELARCVKDHGFVGALINNHLNGEFYDSSKLGPVFARVVELDVRIYIHPTFATDEWMPRYKGNYSDEAAQSLSMYGWGWHSETGLHVLRLWASGLLDDHPSLKLIIGHVGEMLPFQLDRIFPMSTRWASNTRDLKTVWNENIWITTSGMFSSAPMSCLLKMCKIDGILYSVDHPFSANEKGLRFVEKLKKSGMLSHEDLTAICSSNAERSLRLNS